MQYALPPVGITTTRAQIGGKVYEQFTVRCPEEGCWFVVTLANTKGYAERVLDSHKNGVPYPSGERGWSHCPSPPLRESLPSAASHVERLWNELDDVTEALATQASYRDMTGETLKGYARGVAFSVVMLDTILFPTVEEVARHAMSRRKMRLGEVPYSPTASRHWTSARMSDFVPSSEAARQVIAAGALAPRRTASDKVAALSADTIAAIKGALQAGMFSKQDLATIYKVPIEVIESVGA